MKVELRASIDSIFPLPSAALPQWVSTCRHFSAHWGNLQTHKCTLISLSHPFILDAILRSSVIFQRIGRGRVLIQYIVTLSYWLGVFCAAAAIVTRGLGLLGMTYLSFPAMGPLFGYQSFVDRACFFFLISIATVTYAASRKLLRGKD